jgi:hypothetical protein
MTTPEVGDGSDDGHNDTVLVVEVAVAVVDAGDVRLQTLAPVEAQTPAR